MKSLSDSVNDVHRSVASHDSWERSEMVTERMERAAAISDSANAVKVAAEVVARALLVADDRRAQEKKGA